MVRGQGCLLKMLRCRSNTTERVGHHKMGRPLCLRHATFVAGVSGTGPPDRRLDQLLHQGILTLHIPDVVECELFGKVGFQDSVLCCRTRVRPQVVPESENAGDLMMAYGAGVNMGEMNSTIFPHVVESPPSPRDGGVQALSTAFVSESFHRWIETRDFDVSTFRWSKSG